MSVVNLLGINVMNNPAKFGDPYTFEITFECLEPLQKDLEWKLIYVGSAQSAEHDQELDSLLVGPIPVGVNKFIFEGSAPDTTRIPPTDIIGVTVILLTCSYDDREFVRVGYYVNNEYDNPEMAADPPITPVLDRVRRHVLSEKPRVTRFAIKWDSEESAPPLYPPEQPEADLTADGEEYGAEEAELEDDEDDEDETAEGAESAAKADGDDDAMGGVAAEDKGDESEDLEGESSGSEDLEELEEEDEGEGLEEEGEGEGEGMEVDEPETKAGAANGSAKADTVMAH